MTEKFQTSAYPSPEEPNVQIHLRNLRANDDADKARLGVWYGLHRSAGDVYVADIGVGNQPHHKDLRAAIGFESKDSYLVLPEDFAYTLGFAFGRYNPDKAEQDAYGASYDLQAERFRPTEVSAATTDAIVRTAMLGMKYALVVDAKQLADLPPTAQHPDTQLLIPEDWQGKVDTTGIDRSGRPI